MRNAAPAEPTPASVLLQPPPITYNLASDTSLSISGQTATQDPVPAFTRTSITTKLSDSGKTRAFTAKVFTHSGWTPTGAVTFTNGLKILRAEAPLDHGITTIKVEAADVNGGVTAIYSGDSRHATSSDELMPIPSTVKAEPAATMDSGVPCDVNAEHTPTEVPCQAAPRKLNPSGKGSSQATGKLRDPKVLALFKRVSSKMVVEEASKQARRAATQSRKHVPSQAVAHDDTAAAFISVDAGNAMLAAADLGAEDATQPEVSADGGGSAVDELPEVAALEHEIVTLLQERQEKTTIFGRNKNAVQESKEEVAHLQEELDRAFYDYKQELAKPGRNGRWTPFLRSLDMSRATADRWANRHDLRVNPKPLIGPDEALSGPTDKDITALVKKVVRLARVLKTPDSVAQFLHGVTAVLQPPTSAT